MSRAEHYANLHAAVTRYVPAGEQAEMEKFLRTIMRAENHGGSLAAKNDRSTATGLFQFTKGTWGAYGHGSIYDAEAQCDAVVRLAQANEAQLKKVLHRDLTAGEYYLAHFAGSGGATKVVTADSATPLKNLLSTDAMLSNAPIKFRGKSFAQFTAGDLRAWADTKMNVDMDAREEYKQRHDEKKTTPEEDALELAQRQRILKEFGMSEKFAAALPLDNILGQVFFALLKIFMNDAATPAERMAQELPPQTPTPIEPVMQTGLPTKKPSTQIDVASIKR